MICDVIGDYFIRKKETICHISVIWDTEIMKLFTQPALGILQIQSQDFHGCQGHQTGTKRV